MDNVIGKMRNWGLLGMILCLLVACQDDWSSENIPDQGRIVNLMGRLQQQNESRANDAGFVDGDRMGIYMVDYVNGQPGGLSPTDNRATNVLYTFNAAVNKWESATALYWKDKTTPADFYGYYPGVNYIENPSAYSFEVSYQQHVVPEEGEMSHYEASDFLWGKVSAVTPTTETIVLSYKHRMAGVSVKLVMGKNFTQTEWDKLSKQVQVDNTIRTATIDLAKGVPVAVGSVDKSIQMYAQSDGTYRAVVVPQKVDAGKKLLSFTLDGTSYSHSLPSEMHYQMGKMHTFTITVDKKDAAGDYSFAVSYDGITDWVNDEISHSFSSNTYISIHCPEIGTLKQCIAAAGYDYKEMQNLKVTGELTEDDFRFIRDEMSELRHLNLREVDTKNVILQHRWVTNEWGNNEYLPRYMDNAIPEGAFYGNNNIRSIILPSSVTHIGSDAFRECQLMYSTLEIPEGVTFIGGGAFCYNDFNGVTLILPSSLDSIGSGYNRDCRWECELNLSDNIKYIEGTIQPEYYSAPRFKGVFHVPSKLKEISEGAFCNLGTDGSFTGDIEIPQGVTEIGASAFKRLALKNRVDLTIPKGVKKIGYNAFAELRLSSLHLNDDLERIERDAFLYTNIPNQVVLPTSLVFVGSSAFRGCGMEGELVIPENCLSIGGGAFGGNDITQLTLPSKLQEVAKEAFENVGRITELTIPKYVDWIGNRAFASNAYLQTVICLNPEPPMLDGNPFEGLYMDKVILQVPEQSVELYRNTDGWNQFQNITAYRELAFNVPDIVSMDKGTTRMGILRAEGAWEVAECPSWITVSPASGTTKKEELTVTVQSQAAGSATREGRIVFRLKDKDYTTYTTIRQVGGDLAEDETIVLQEASAGAPRAVPLFIVGEGYNADDIAEGKFLREAEEQMEHFFSIEPLKTYRNYFTVSAALAVSPESGIYGMTKFDGDNEKVKEYARTYGVGIDGNEDHATILVLRNTNMLDNHTELYMNGLSISWMGISTDVYPFNQQGFILHELAGIAFGKLAKETINHFTFMKSCGCPGCNVTHLYHEYRPRGWWQNVSISAKMGDLPWSHYIFDEKYAPYVDVYEGAMNHSRGAYRSEPQSVMGNTYVPYFNTISREILVRRIMERAGVDFSMEDFLAKDKIELPEELQNE